MEAPESPTRSAPFEHYRDNVRACPNLNIVAFPRVEKLGVGKLTALNRVEYL